MDHKGSDPKAGRLLVATPMLGDPNFKRTVVLIVEHEDVQGTLGVVLNRPTEIAVGRVLEQWTELATEPSVVFRGGPVAPSSALALALIPGKDEPIGWRALDGAPALARLGLLDLDTPPRLLAPAITSLRVYAGYSGWSPGQLETEINEGAWYVLPAQPGDVFAPDPDRLWRQVLRRQDGDLAFLATYPDDPTLNLSPGGATPRTPPDAPDGKNHHLIGRASGPSRGTPPYPPMSGPDGPDRENRDRIRPTEPDKGCVLENQDQHGPERVRVFTCPLRPLPDGSAGVAPRAVR